MNQRILEKNICDCKCLKKCENGCQNNEVCIDNLCHCDNNHIRVGNTCRLKSNLGDFNTHKVCTCREELINGKQYFRNNVNDKCMLNPLNDIEYLEELKGKENQTISGFISKYLPEFKDMFKINIIPSKNNGFNLKYPEEFIKLCYSCDKNIPNIYNKKERDLISKKCS